MIQHILKLLFSLKEVNKMAQNYLGQTVVALLLAGILFTGCSQTESPPPVGTGTSSSAVSAPAQSESAPFPEPEPSQEEPPAPVEVSYVQQLAEQVTGQFYTPEMSEYQRAKAAFDYMIQHTYLDEPIGQELWRVHGGGDEPIPFVEQRALSPLRFGVGMCEDYAATLTLLLREMGLEARYGPGLTYSAEGHLVDHAWTMVQIDGVWYHLDSQLEDNISCHGSIRYRYFLKGDAAMAVSHRWEQNLIDSGLLTAEQNAEIAADWLTPAGPQDYPSPQRKPLTESAAPDFEALRQ